jgi:hypothetical protein
MYINFKLEKALAMGVQWGIIMCSRLHCTTLSSFHPGFGFNSYAEANQTVQWTSPALRKSLENNIVSFHGGRISAGRAGAGGPTCSKMVTGAVVTREGLSFI